MANYTIYQDGGHYTETEGLNAAIELAEELLGGVDKNTETTFTVENADGYLLAAVTNRRIMGTFHKQQWGGHRGNDTIDIDEESFDATNAILLLDHKDLMRLQDRHTSSDDIGLQHIVWTGPYCVQITEAICSYFGVSYIGHITPEALMLARNREKAQPPVAQVVTLSIKLNLLVTPGASVSEFIEDLDYSVVSNTAGVTVSSTEIVDSN
ncbi:hypothetical protein [Comamonas thiooxydans]|uniref:hypothetical protein n=1 Tax=Comamonas thiooxydans TaxID=363952 RepID=UPI000B4232E5|nr:hypothetical protein [Comamonas thiooxydans]